MTWFRVDDGWHKHRKRIRAGLDMEGFAARGLWLDAGSWSSDELTDGFVPDDVLDYLAPGIGQTLAKRLERARLWTRIDNGEDGGWQFHQWGEHQPTKEEVEAALSKKASGGKLGNHRRWHAEKGKFDERCPYCRAGGDRITDRITDRSTDRTSDRSTESGANPPTRPDPTRPDKSKTSTATTVAAQQDAFEGMPQPPEPEETPTQMAFRISRDWIAYREAQGAPVPAKPKTDPAIPLKNVLEPSLASGYTEAEVRATLRRLGRGVPTRQAFDEAIAALRTGEDGNRQGGRMKGGMVPESNAPKNYPADQRCPRHRSNPKHNCGSCKAEASAGVRT